VSLPFGMMYPQMSGASMIEVDDLASAPGEITAAQWRQIVNGATDTAIISTDERGIVTSWNSGACRILGWSEPEMLGKSLGRIFADGDGQARLSREMEDAIAHGRGGGEEGWRLRKDESRFWAVGELSPMRWRKDHRLRQDLARSYASAEDGGNDPRGAACARSAQSRRIRSCARD
jgi:PAS domain S-box-containing protein